MWLLCWPCPPPLHPPPPFLFLYLSFSNMYQPLYVVDFPRKSPLVYKTINKIYIKKNLKTWTVSHVTTPLTLPPPLPPSFVFVLVIFKHISTPLCCRFPKKLSASLWNDRIPRTVSHATTLLTLPPPPPPPSSTSSLPPPLSHQL